MPWLILAALGALGALALGGGDLASEPSVMNGAFTTKGRSKYLKKYGHHYLSPTTKAHVFVLTEAPLGGTTKMFGTLVAEAISMQGGSVYAMPGGNFVAFQPIEGFALLASPSNLHLVSPTAEG